MIRSKYKVWIQQNVICIEDLNEPETKSVTNDIENVINDLKKQFSSYILKNYKIIYQDTNNIWDEIELKNDLNFDKFISINTESLTEALEIVTEKQLELSSYLNNEKY